MELAHEQKCQRTLSLHSYSLTTVLFIADRVHARSFQASFRMCLIALAVFEQTRRSTPLRACYLIPKYMRLEPLRACYLIPISLSLSLSLYFSLSISLSLYTYVYIYIYTHTYA